MNVDLDAYRNESLETWEEMAPGWEDRNEWMVAVAGPVNEWIVGSARPEAGQTAIDIAAGPGDLGFQVAERVGDTGRVMSTDFSPQMVEAARRIGAGRGLDNVEYRVLDAERMDLPDDAFDVAVCRWGYMLMADPAAALRETRRVLRDGGRLAFAVWAEPERNQWAAVPAMTLVQAGHMPPPEPGAPGIFAMADAERTLAMTRDAGFEDVALEEIRFDFRYADFEDLWDSLIRLAGPLARAIGPLTDEQRDAVREAIRGAVEGYRSEDGSYTIPAACLGISAA